MQCLIIAAGKGSRLRSKADSKPLVPLLGMALIERVIRTALEAGADNFYVVVGHQAEKVLDFLDNLTRQLAVPITTIENECWAGTDNGLSVLAAKNYLTKPFLLMMTDHLFEPAIARRLIATPLQDGEIALAVDGAIHNPLIDMNDVTYVRQESGRIRDIGKGLRDFNGLDTGVFLCTTGIFGALEEQARQGDTTLSAAVRLLAANDCARAIDVSGRFWIDVDDPTSFDLAKQAMLDRLKDKSNDGPISLYLNRPVSIRLSKILVNYPISPTLISLFSFLLSMMAAGMFALGGYAALALGGVVAQFASIIDGCDGEVARLKHQSSPYGGWFDAVLDRYADAFMLFGLTWHVYSTKANALVLFTGFMAIIGSFMLSYPADKYDNLMRERIAAGRPAGLRLGRDVRVLFISLGAVFHQALFCLATIAVVMNLETLRRIIIAGDHG